MIIKSLGEANEMQNLTAKAISQSNSASVKEVPLVQIKVLVLKHVRLEVVVPNDSYSLSLGQKLEVNFTIKNLASSETFTFLVSYNRKLLSLKATMTVTASRTTKKQKFILAKQQLCTPSRFFVHFLAVTARLQRESA